MARYGCSSKEVERTTSNVLLRGRHPNEYIKDFKKQTNTTTYNASRLLVTESARVQAESQKLTYLKDLGEDGEYKYVAKIDKKTSKICHSLNSKVFKVKDMIFELMHHQCTLGVEVLQYHMWAIGEIDSLLSVKVSIELRIKN